MKLPIAPLTALLRTLPDALHATVLARVVNHLMKGQELAARLDELAGRRICIRVTDAACAPVFRIRDGGLECADGEGWDVRISGRLSDLLALALREEDADTLFFQRRLALEGDTAAGLRVKNLLDALDFDLDAHCTAVLGPHAGPRAASVARAIEDRARALRAAAPVRNAYPCRPS